MPTIPEMRRAERRRLERALRKTVDLAEGRRILSVLRLATGASLRRVAEELSMAPSAVGKNAARYESEGLAGLRVDRRRFNGYRKVTAEYLEGLRQVLQRSPQDFGWERPTWTCELLAAQMHSEGFELVAPCTVGRALRVLGATRKSPKPFVCCPWPGARREKRLRELRRLVERSPPDEPVFYSDEVDIHLNPKIGPDWMLPGRRRWVRTPGKNKKHYLAGALDARRGKLVWVEGDQKASWLFCNLLRELARRYRRAPRIHLIVDNYGIHDSRLTRHVLEHELQGKVRLHFLPPYCPDANRIERVWLDLHANVTRNHRCPSIEQLMQNVRSFLHAFNDRRRLNPSLRRAA